MNRNLKSWLWIGALSLATLRVEAGNSISGAIASVSYVTTGSEQDLFYAPGDLTRSQIQFRVLTHFTATANVIAAPYRYVARLLDSAGNPARLRNLDGSASTTFAFPQFFVTLSSGGNSTRTDALSLSLADGFQLNPYSTYRVEITLQYFSGGIWGPEGLVQTSLDRRFFHFINQTSSDAAYNVIAEILSVVWKRTSTIDGTIGDAHWLEAEVVYRLHRYDNFALAAGSPVPSDLVPVKFGFAVQPSSGPSVPTLVQVDTSILSAPSYVDGAVRTPWVSSLQVERFKFHPNSQLHSGTEPNFQAVATISHVENPSGSGSFAQGNTVLSDTATVLHFTGQLYWGTVLTALSDFSNDPTVGLFRRSTDVSVGLQNPVVGVPGATIVGLTTDPTIQVSLDDSGTARVLSGHASATMDSADHVLHGVHYRYAGPIGLSASGVGMDITLQLPAGMGVGKPGYSLQSRLTGHFNQADAIFQPTGTNVFTVSAEQRVVLDTRPLYFATSALKWYTDLGVIRFDPTGVDYVRRDAFAALDSLTDLSGSDVEKPSNERYYQFVSGTVGSAVVRITPGGRTALSVGFNLNSGQFVAHFPFGVTTAWSSGQLTLQDDVPVASGSGLAPAGSITVTYEQGCPDGGCLGHVADLACDLPQLKFTPDSGLVADGFGSASIGGTNSLRWGHNPTRLVMAHEAGPFQKAGFAIPGHVLLAGTTPYVEDGAGVLLDSGAMVSAPALPSGVQMIRPGTLDYTNGVGDYAGINLSVSVESDPTSVRGIARLGDATSPALFPLSVRAKYYARRAGVNGLHEAGAGGFPSTPITIYQYPFQFQSFSLSFLANANVDSLTHCSISLPYPVHDLFRFDKVTFTCVGAPDTLQIAQGQSLQVFDYWAAGVAVQNVGFAPRDRAASACDASQQQFLAVGSVVHGGGIEDALSGTLYLSAQGNIITPADSERPEGVSFYLGARSIVTVAGVDPTTGGPGNFYQLTLGKAYFNNPNYPNSSPGFGWLNLFGGLKLPFYGSTPVQIMTPGVNDPSSVFYVNGGWTEGGVAAADPTGDPAHGGHPSTSTWEDYRGSSAYAPVAQGEFLDVVNLSFPLKWLSALHEFTGIEPIERNLLFLLETSRELYRLSATDISMQLGTAYNGLPRLYLSTGKIDVVGDSLDVDLAGALDLGGIVADAAGPGLSREVANGFDAVRGLSSYPLGPFFDSFLKNLATSVAPGVRTALQGDPALVASRVHDALQPLRLGDHSLLLAEGLRLDVLNRLSQATNSLLSLWDPANGLFQRDASGNRLRLAAVVREILVRGLRLDAATAGGIIAPALAPLLAPFNDEMNLTEKTMERAADRLIDLYSRYSTDSGDLYLELRSVFADPTTVAELNSFTDAVERNLVAMASQPHWVEENVSGPGDALDYVLYAGLNGPLQSSDAFNQVRHVVNYQFRSIEEQGVAAADQMVELLQQIVNTVGRTALRSADQLLQNTVFGPMAGFLGFFNGEGYVLFHGDEVRRMRISGKGGIDLHGGNKFDLGFRFQINALDSDGNASCAATSTSVATEVTLDGFTDTTSDHYVPMDTFDPELDPLDTPVVDDRHEVVSDSFSLQLKATFDQSISFSGFGGGFSWSSSKNYGGVQMLRLAGACMFTPTEYYIAGALDGKFGGASGVRVQGGLFIGHTCTFDPLRLINSDFVRVLGPERPFGGFYVYARGWIPIVSYGCALNLSAGAGAGAYADFDSGRFGASLFAGVNGEVLCVLQATATIELTGGIESGGFVFDGTGSLMVRAGYCPFCVRFTKEVHATYHQSSNSWDVQL